MGNHPELVEYLRERESLGSKEIRRRKWHH